MHRYDKPPHPQNVAPEYSDYPYGPDAYQADAYPELDPDYGRSGRFEKLRLANRPSNKTLATAAAGLAAGAALYYLWQQRTPAAPRTFYDDAPRRTADDGSWQQNKAVTGKTVLIRKPRAELYRFWRNFENLASFMKDVQSVTVNGQESVWEIAAPLGQRVRLVTELVKEVENQMLAWRSTAESEVFTEGVIQFRDAPADRGTLVEAVIYYKPPAGAIGRRIAQLFRHEPAVQTRHELKRFKMLMETGEVATSAHFGNTQRAGNSAESGKLVSNQGSRTTTKGEHQS